MKKIILILPIMLAFASCTNPPEAHKSLEALGFTDITITGYNFFACSQDDFFQTGFTATNPQGKQVSGTVCSGLFFKNSTVRF